RNVASRVAFPASTIRSPVAKGSRVPAWPSLRPSTGRSAAIAPNDDRPAALSSSNMPSAKLGLHLALDQADQLRPVEVAREPGGARVAAAATGAGDPRDVDDPVRGAERHLVARAVRRLADERGHLDALDRPQAVDHAVGGGLVGAGLGDVGPGQP